MKISIKLIIFSILTLIFIDVIIHEVYTYYKTGYVENKRNKLNDQFRYEIFNKDMSDRVLGYVSGYWRSASGSIIHINFLSQPKVFTIDNEEYNILSIDNIDAIFGVIQFTATDSVSVHNQKFQINKIFNTAGLIVLIVDPETTTCKDIKKIDPFAPICAKALYWREKPDDKEKTEENNSNIK